MTDKNNRQYSYIFISSGLFFFLLLGFILYFQWDRIYELKLGDNDNYMRYLQFTHWIEHGNWFLEPMQRFNPDDGQIMHWSRVVDIPLALVTKIAAMYTDMRSAETFAILFVPLTYLFGIACFIGYFSHKFFNAEVAAIAIIFTYGNLLVVKFMDGSIDHHSLQLLLFSAILATSALIQASNRAAILQGLFIALSLWVGLENIFVIALLIAFISLYAIIHRVSLIFKYHAIACLSAGIFGALFLLLNRPIDEFLIPYYDAISIPFIAGFIASAIFCTLATIIIKTNTIYTWIGIIISAAICFTPILYLYPELKYGALHNYPPLLVKHWLSHVSEAISLLAYIVNLNDTHKIFYILITLPALISPLFIKMNAKQWLYFFLAVTTLAFPVFWQYRSIFLAYIVIIPLQAFTCYKLRENVSIPAIRTIAIFITMPIVIFFILHFSIPPNKISKGIYPDIQDSIELLNENNIHNQLILAPIDYGTKILTFTDNKIISAPYHRNIKGNTTSTQIFIANSEIEACDLLHKNKINYILLSKDGNSNLYFKDKNFIANLLAKKEINCVDFIENKNTSYLYRVKY